jgi:hypothetical protein
MHDLVPVAGRRTNAPRITVAVDGDSAAEVVVPAYDPPADPPVPGSAVAFHGAGLLLWGEDGRLVRLERAAVRRGSQVRNYVLFELLPPGTGAPGQEVDCGGGPLHLRLERQGTQVVGLFSTDGASWQRPRPQPFLSTRARLGVAAVNTSTQPFRARFQKFGVGTP